MVTYPEDWREVKLGEALVYTQPTNYIENNYVEHGVVPVLTAGKSFILGYSDKTDSAYKNLPAILFDDFTTEVRYLDYPFMVKSSATKFLNLKSDYYDIKYLYYWLDKLKFQIEAHERHWISRFSKFNIVLPPLAEQQAIASALSDFHEHIDNLSELIEKKKAIRDGALEDLVSGRIRLDGFEGEWEEKSFKDLGDILTGLTYSPDNIRPSGKLVIRSSNVQDDRLSFEDNVFVDRTCVISEDIKKGDIILCVRNGSASLIGKSAYANSDLDATFGAFMSNFRCKNHDSSGFVYYFTKSVMFKKFVKQILGATINQITKTDLKRVTLKIPVDIEEQQAIADVLTAMDEEIESLKIEKEKMIQIKEGAMDDLLTGRVRLKA